MILVDVYLYLAAAVRSTLTVVTGLCGSTENYLENAKGLA